MRQELSAVLNTEPDRLALGRTLCRCTRLHVAYNTALLILISTSVLTGLSASLPCVRVCVCVCVCVLHIYWVVENVSARACYIHLSAV